MPKHKPPTHYGLGAVLRCWRKRRGLLCREVADQIGVDKALVVRWEQNVKPIPDARLVEFAAAVGCLSVTQMLSIDVAGAETTGRGEAPYPRHSTRRMPR